MSAPTVPEREGAAVGTVDGMATAAIEWPTFLLILATYAGWLASTLAYRRWPLVLVAPVTAVVIALHSSLQHEIVHGHPTRWRRINRLLAIVPFTPWLPFARYEESHLAHHRDARLTDPYDDPESYYWTRADYARLGGIGRSLVRVQETLAGRVTVGPFWVTGRFLLAELRALWAGQPGVRAVWAEHLLWCVPLAVWLRSVCGMPLWIYVLTMAIPGTSLTLTRSFAEHRARPAMPVSYTHLTLPTKRIV